MQKINNSKRMIAFITVAFILICQIVTPNNLKVQAGTQAAYFINPTVGSDENNGLTADTAFKSITKARDEVRKINSNMTGDIYVFLRGGTYLLSDKITFNTSDSGTNGYNIIYKAYNNETPVISSQYDVTGWTLFDASKNIYRASVGIREFRQIYVNEIRGIRARDPNLTDSATGGDYFKILNEPYDANGNAQTIKSPFTISSNQIGSWASSPDVEFHWISHWSDFKSHVTGYTVNGDTATVQIANANNYWGYGPVQSNPYYYWENSYSFIDAVGEWYLDTGTQTLYYKPRSTENMSSVKVSVPTLETLFEVSGSVENVALGKVATASSSVEGCEPSKAIDGLNTSRWMTQNEGDKWLMLDLGKTEAVNRYIVKHASKNGDTALFDTKLFKLQSSPDGINNWTDIDIIDNSSDPSQLRGCDPETGRVGGFTARYIRLYITEATQDGAADTYARIQELQLLRYTYTTNIQFIGLDFKYTNWIAPNTNGYSSVQAGYVIEKYSTNKMASHSEAWEPIPAMINLMYTRNIRIEKNRFKYAGAISIKSMFESEYTTIIGNVIDTCAGGGIYIGAGEFWFDGRTHAASRFDTISNNYITDCGIDYKDSVAIFAPFPQYLAIEYNEIQNMPWGGIHIGWIWDDKDLYGATDVEIKNNRIHNIMRALDDNGGVYTLGRIPNMNIHDNYIFNLSVSKYQGYANFGAANAGLYLDNGSCYKTVQNNVVNNSSMGMYACNLPSYNNTFQNNYDNSNVTSKISNNGSPINHDNLSINNIKVSDQNWTAEAIAIMNSANIQAMYRYMIPAKNQQSIGTAFEYKFLGSFMYNFIATGEYLTSPSRNCYATLLNNGNFVLYDGIPGSTSTKIWETNTIDTDTSFNGKHFITLSNNGYLNIWRGTAAYDNMGIFKSIYVGNDTSGYKRKGLLLTVLDNKNIAFYSGSSPDFIALKQTDRTMLKTWSFIREGQYLSSLNRSYFMTLETNGNLSLHSGSDPQHSTGLLWQSGATSDIGNYFAVLQDDGNFCIYKGTSPSDNKGFLWAINSTQNDYFKIVQDGTDYKFILSKPTDFNEYVPIINSKNIIQNMSQGLTITQFFSGITAGSNILTFKDIDGNTFTNENTYIGTGKILEVDDGESTTQYTTVLYGDISGDGFINLSDLILVRDNLLEVNKSVVPNMFAGDLYNEGNITLNDLVGIMSFVSESGTINQNR